MGDRERYEIKDAKKGMLKYLVPSKRRNLVYELYVCEFNERNI
jgi:hypothetical protein